MLQSKQNAAVALYSSGPAGLGQQKVDVFPMEGPTRSVRLPFALGRMAFSPDGLAIYAAVPKQSPAAPRLAKIVLEPLHISYLSGTADVLDVWSVAASTKEDVLICHRRCKNAHNAG
jgi:hypothetical protein